MSDESTCTICGRNYCDLDHYSVPITGVKMVTIIKPEAHYGYGIVDKDGNPYWDESCVCQDPEPMEDMVLDINTSSQPGLFHEDKIPYRVVRLMYQEIEIDNTIKDKSCSGISITQTR